MTSISFLIVSLGISSILAQKEAPTITIPNGKLRGTINQTVEENRTYYAYRGIPYAKKPTGSLRFASPVKNNPWTGTLDATQDREQCTQTSGLPGNGPGSGVLGSEDCLYINVYTTDINCSLPVMVWIYGGGFVYGSSAYNQSAPDYLLEKGVIFVSFNYRLGVFGFLSTEDLVAPGNWGLKDQILALKWVKDNIGYFGGDPNKVTIFGESAGSASVSYLVQSNLTTGLFQGGIMESGTSLCLWALTRNAKRKAFEVGLELGIISLSSKTLINNLRKVDYKVLKSAESNVTQRSFLSDNILAGLPFGIVKEPAHQGAVFSSKSHQLLKQGRFQKIPLIIGYNSYEGAGLQDFVKLITPVLLQYELDITKLAPYDLTDNFLKKLPAGFRIRNHYFSPGLLSTQNEALTKFFTVDQFNRPIRETVNLMSDHTNLYYYQFSYEGALGNPNPNYEGVGHSEELNYLFARRGNTSSPQDKLTRDRFVTLWTNFGKTGNPTSSGNSTLLQGAKWIPNTPKDNTNLVIKCFNINRTLTMENNPDQTEWMFYQDIYRKFGDPPYDTY